MFIPRLVLFCRSKADDPNGVFVRTFGEDHDEQRIIDQTDGNEANFAIVEPVILPFQ